MRVMNAFVPDDESWIAATLECLNTRETMTRLLLVILNNQTSFSTMSRSTRSERTSGEQRLTEAVLVTRSMARRRC